MIKLVPIDLLDLIFIKFKQYYQQYLISKNYQINQINYNNITINLIFNLNSKERSSCKNYTYKNNIYSVININAGEDLSIYRLDEPQTKKIILGYYKHIIAHELLHLIQYLNPKKYYPYKKIKDHCDHELKDIEFYPNLINYRYQADNNLQYFLNTSPEVNNIMINDYRKYKKLVKILYKECYG